MGNNVEMGVSGCYQPWMEMQIQYDKTVGCCCYYHGKKSEWEGMNDSHFDIERYWNGPEMQEVRKIIQNGQDRGTGCQGCQFVKYGIPELSLHPPHDLSALQKDNYEKAVGNFSRREIIVDSAPVRYYFNFGLACNLRCVMCFQAELRKINKQVLSSHIFRDLEDSFQRAEQIALIGGEPFVIPEARTFLKSLNESTKLNSVRVALFTNGTLLDSYFDLYKDIPRMNFCISLDAIGEPYSHIRQGAHWERTENNIRMVKRRGESLGHEWNVTIASVLMKTSLASLVPYVRWCVNNSLACHFVPIVPNTMNREEDIFSYPQLLDQVGDWESILDKAIEMLEDDGRIEGAADRLRIMKNQLRDNYGAYEKNPHLFSSPELSSVGKALARVGDGGFVVWGTGRFYELNFSSILRTYHGKNFLGFIDNNPFMWGEKVDGRKVFSPEKLELLKPEMILIASAMRGEILAQIQEMKNLTCEVY